MSHSHHSQSSSSTSTRAGGRRHRSPRGGHGGKYLPQGRGYRGGLPDGEQPEQLSEAEAAELEELEARYGRRTLGTNADRYEEPEPEIGADGQPIAELEVDLRAFLGRQRMEDPPGLPLVPATVDDDDVDHSLAHITSNPLAARQSRKGKTQYIDWDASLEEMQHEKNAARAQSDLKERLRANAAHQMGKTAIREHTCRQVRVRPLKEAPPLPQDSHLASKSLKVEMEEFLDDLLP
ncbi:hypothetical protein DFH94DRAFT_702207 [Russula ochroleuca]|uniref:Uncharacterized protein n=1 Tax=Russula ochroleuca TaxID=152965 RepID=A0A9P5N5C2_9AGAM|nr:hypothetical protein DFH94DRAFT_702207 [Russula ochroleuca]